MDDRTAPTARRGGAHATADRSGVLGSWESHRATVQGLRGLQQQPPATTTTHTTTDTTTEMTRGNTTTDTTKTSSVIDADAKLPRPTPRQTPTPTGWWGFPQLERAAACRRHPCRRSAQSPQHGQVCRPNSTSVFRLLTTRPHRLLHHRPHRQYRGALLPIKSAPCRCRRFGRSNETLGRCRRRRKHQQRSKPPLHGCPCCRPSQCAVHTIRSGHPCTRRRSGNSAYFHPHSRRHCLWDCNPPDHCRHHQHHQHR